MDRSSGGKSYWGNDANCPVIHQHFGGEKELKLMPEIPVSLQSRDSLAEAGGQPLIAWNATNYSYARDKCVPALISAQAVACPKGTAVVMGAELLTYAELDARSNQIARCLLSFGVGPEVAVGLCLPRSAALITAALGVLKTGAAYVPLDPAYPLQRITWMLNDAQPAVLLSTQDFTEQLPKGKWRVLNLDSDDTQIAHHSRDPVFCSATPENVAYIIYTSGSTGQPKGVQIGHDNLLNLVFWHQREFGVTAADRASQLASPAFDAAVWEVWPYLASGASVHVADDNCRSDPEALRSWLVSNGITIAFVPTPLAECMITLKWPPETALRVLLTGADTLHTFPPSGLPFLLVNNYGPTECTVVATSGSVCSDGRCEALPSIGRPISNVQIYIMDDQMKQVPVGVPGEIYIGGAGVGRGYLNAPELNAAKFIPNPFESNPNARLYKTGDLGCYLPDGQIAFRGRLDEQVKIRGYRIEPNEITALLTKHPTILASAVLARQNASGDTQLVAYVVPKGGNNPSDESLRAFLSGHLPDYMVPAVFVRIDSLPVNANGKIDRAALPAPNDSNSLRAVSHVPPRTAIEQRISEIVASLLGFDRVSVQDNFFMLGGHSLLATQVIARTREAFQVSLSLRSLFDSPTVETLAAEVERLLYLRFESMSDANKQSSF